MLLILTLKKNKRNSLKRVKVKPINFFPRQSFKAAQNPFQRAFQFCIAKHQKPKHKLPNSKYPFLNFPTDILFAANNGMQYVVQKETPAVRKVLQGLIQVYNLVELDVPKTRQAERDKSGLNNPSCWSHFNLFAIY